MGNPSWYPSLKRYGPDRRQLSDGQWRLIEDLFPWTPPKSAGGRPPVPPREVFEAVLWLLRNGGRWRDLPHGSPSESTCRRRLREWVESGTLTEVWRRLVSLAEELGRIDWEHLIADGTFCRAKKGANPSAPAARGPGPRPSCSWTATAPRSASYSPRRTSTRAGTSNV